MQFRSYQQFPPGVKNILIMCVILFFGTKIMAQKGIDLYQLLGLHYFDSVLFKPWQLFSHMFMHGGFSHILFNMLGLYMFGAVLENILGTKRFLTLYFFSGFGAVALDFAVKGYLLQQDYGQFMFSADLQFELLKDIQLDLKTFGIETSSTSSDLARNLFMPMVGASGALYGILVAFAVFFPNTTLTLLFFPFPIKAKYLIPIMLGIDLFLGIGQFNWDPVAHFAHLGGAIFGYFMVRHWNKTRRDTFY
jgi:membrane associated rhomboid family serine protease